MDSGMQSGMDSRSLPRSLACSRACMDKPVDSDAELPVENTFRCLQGFSAVQINILGILKGYSDVLAYWQIAKLVEQHYRMSATAGAVRGALERLFPRKFLLRKRAAKGRHKGNSYAFVSDPCQHIRPCTSVETNAEDATQSPSNVQPSILKEEDRKNLSISSKNSTAERLLEELSEDDIAFHWPILAQNGFGTHQIRQILQSLSKVSLSAAQVMPGLTYASYEFAKGDVLDKEGKPITDVCGYVFASLARHGCYRRPPGYIDPLEAAEQEALEDAKRREQASKARTETQIQAKFAEAFEQWLAVLSPQEMQRIVNESSLGTIHMPEDVALRNYYRTHVAGKEPEADAT